MRKKALPSSFLRFYDNMMYKINIKLMNIKFNIMKDTCVWLGGSILVVFASNSVKKME